MPTAAEILLDMSYVTLRDSCIKLNDCRIACDLMGVRRLADSAPEIHIHVCFGIC